MARAAALRGSVIQRVDRKLRVLAQAEPYVGYPETTWLNATLFEFVAEDHHERTAEVAEHVFRTGKVGHITVPLYAADGSVVWVESRAAALRERGRIVQLVGLSRPVQAGLLPHLRWDDEHDPMAAGELAARRHALLKDIMRSLSACDVYHLQTLAQYLATTLGSSTPQSQPPNPPPGAGNPPA